MITAAQHLQTVIDRWSDLADALTTRQQTTWPPTMGVQQLILDDDARAAHTAERLDTAPDAPGTRPVPLDLDIYDTMRHVEAELIHCADVIASQIQRPPMTPGPRGAGWTPAEIARRDQLPAADAADPRRWTWPRLAEDAEDHRRPPGPGRERLARTAIGAAAWLAGRVENSPGPFLPLGPTRAASITAVAVAAAARVETALRIARRAAAVDWPCPACRGQLEVHGGDGQPPAVKCAGCGRTWRPSEEEPTAA
ncbi:hypothetical protein HUF15_00650 [Streptomyces samsunensis]|uniref:hypothetical protein n=1 Tax=Streptomyces malaysiensis TaxID=92644 RepID=UPI001582B689|nr:hypothetical protein [Streptomyces samsunensis]NUH35290.1 hypothetical protein [Streptomyces samsunensis]